MISNACRSLRKSSLILIRFFVIMLVMMPLCTMPTLSAKPSSEGKKATLTVRAKIFDKLTEAQAMIEKGSYLEGKKILDNLYDSRDRKSLNAVELAYTFNFYGFYYYSKENFKEAIRYYKKVADTIEISDAMKIQALYTLGQLEFVEENFGKSLEYLLSWLDLAQKPTGDSFVLIGQVYYQIKNYNQAIAYVEKGISLSSKEGKKPKENWLRLQAALYFEKRNVKKTALVYEKLVSYYPKKTYFTQLASMYGELEESLKQTAVMQAAYRAGFLTKETDIINYAYMLLARDLPYKAAVVLDEGISEGRVSKNYKNLKTLGNAYYTAHELKKAVPVLKQAASLANDGEIWMMLASTFLNLEKYKAAENASRSALDKGQLKNEGMAYIILGTATLNQKKYDDAEKAFSQASKYEKTRMHGQQWLNYAQSERKKTEELGKWLSADI